MAWIVPAIKWWFSHQFFVCFSGRVPQVGGKFRTRWEQQVDGTLWLQQVEVAKTCKNYMGMSENGVYLQL